MLYFVIYCTQFLLFFISHFGSDFGRLSGVNNCLLAFCPHIDCVSVQTFEYVALMVSERRCLDMTDRETDRRADGQTCRWTDGQMDRRTWLNPFSRRADQEYIYFTGSQISSSTCSYILQYYIIV